MTNNFGVEPAVNVPMVRVLNEDGKEIFRGWYYRHVNRQIAAFGDKLTELDVEHIVMHDSSADWNMPQKPIATIVRPPHRIEVIDD